MRPALGPKLTNFLQIGPEIVQVGPSLAGPNLAKVRTEFGESSAKSSPSSAKCGAPGEAPALRVMRTSGEKGGLRSGDEDGPRDDKCTPMHHRACATSHSGSRPRPGPRRQCRDIGMDLEYRGHGRDTGRSTAGTNPRPPAERQPGHRWIEPSHPPGHHRDKKRGRRNRIRAARRLGHPDATTSHGKPSRDTPKSARNSADANTERDSEGLLRQVNPPEQRGLEQGPFRKFVRKQALGAPCVAKKGLVTRVERNAVLSAWRGEAKLAVAREPRRSPVPVLLTTQEASHHASSSATGQDMSGWHEAPCIILVWA